MGIHVSGRPRRAPLRIPAGAVAVGVVLALAGPSLRADTIFLKDGTQILDCKVIEETDSLVKVRAPAGDMSVPRDKIHRIQRVKTVHDSYKERLAALREGDAEGHFKLALWCRTAGGLRQESDELLEKVIALKPEHAQTRRLLGQVKLGGEWVAPPPLAIQLKASGANAEDIRTAFDLLLKTRQDMRLAAASEAAPESPLDGCSVNASVIISRKAAMTFYGMTIGGPSYAATVLLQPIAPWIGKKHRKAAVEGQVPASGGGASLAVNNAFGRGSTILHRYLDELTELRLKKLEEEYRKGERERKALEKKTVRATGR